MDPFWRPKSAQDRPKSRLETTFLQTGRFFKKRAPPKAGARFWPSGGPKMRPRGAKSGPSASKVDCLPIFLSLRRVLERFLAAAWAGRDGQEAAQEAPQVAKRAPSPPQERPKRVPSTIFECLNSFEMRLPRKCKSHQKCCKVLQNSRFGGSESQ